MGYKQTLVYPDGEVIRTEVESFMVPVWMRELLDSGHTVIIRSKSTVNNADRNEKKNRTRPFRRNELPPTPARDRSI